MFDLPFDRLDESPRLRLLINNLITAARLEYKNETSLSGAALRDLVKAIKSPNDEVWKELKVSAVERQQYNQVANAAHLTLNG